MSDRDVLEEIFETAHDPHLKVTAIRDRIRSVLAEAGFAEENRQVEEEEESAAAEEEED